MLPTITGSVRPQGKCFFWVNFVLLLLASAFFTAEMAESVCSENKDFRQWPHHSELSNLFNMNTHDRKAQKLERTSSNSNNKVTAKDREENRRFIIIVTIAPIALGVDVLHFYAVDFAWISRHHSQIQAIYTTPTGVFHFAGNPCLPAG
ncbi:MAG: hypothetical protein IPL65_19220 [Lewinellaceae bacterium]|nr:hypothetical protein [Lewinellaceae bacterium]